MKYVGTFGSGWKTIIEKILQESNIKIINIWDGFVIFEVDKIESQKYPYFNNVYLLLDSMKVKTDNIDANIASLVSKIDIDFKIINDHLKGLRHHTFKIKAINENQPAKINYTNLLSIEDKIKKATQMKIERNADIDFVFIQRSEGYLYFLMKLTYNRVTENRLKQGTLRPETCYLLLKFANIQESDIVLDPFCGSGAISREIIKNFKYNMCFASDIDETKVISLKKEYKNNNKKFFIKVADALNLEKYDDNFIDVIVTDPPWNIYNKSSDDFEKFYREMLREFFRILKDDGRVVVLMGNIDVFEKALSTTKLFKIGNKLSVLINGKKANVYLLIK